MQTEIETVTIKKMSKEDIDKVVELEAQIYGEHHWSKQSFLDEINNGLAKYYSLFNSQGELCAYAGCWHILEETHITNIAVSPQYRRRGYGEALLERLINDCYKDKVKYITLEVRISNKPAIALYTKYGFNSFGTRKKYYQNNNEDALIMWTKNIFFDEYKSVYKNATTNLKDKLSVKNI